MRNSNAFSLPDDLRAIELLRFERQVHKIRELIIGDEPRRWLAGVTTALQAIISQAQPDIPRCKNWPVICELAKVNPQMATFIGRLDMQNDPKNLEWYLLYPDCFSIEMVDGPVLLSVLMDYAVEHAHENDYETEEPGKYLVAYEALEHFGIPYERYAAGPDADPRCCKPLPDDLDGEELFGHEVTIRGNKYVVTEDAFGCGELCVSPLEFIDIDSRG